MKHGFILSVAFVIIAAMRPVEEADLTAFYDYAIEQTVRLGGDTDTNAAIAGAVIGAFVGADNLPSAKVQKVLECNITKGSQKKRPAMVQTSTKGTVNAILELCRLAPTNLQVNI